MLERAQRNESAAWDLLVELYASVVYARCRHHWHMPATDAEHIGQEVFTAVALKLKDFQRNRNGSFRAWLRTITDNRCKDALSRKQLAAAAGGSEMRAALENVAEETFSASNIATEPDEKTILIRRALKAVENEFSERDIKIFWSIAVDDRNRQDLASQFGVSENVVYLAWSRVRKRLREIYAELIDDDIL